MDKTVKTGIKEGWEGLQVWFQIDNQTFHLDDRVEDTEEETLEVANFYEKCLGIAFKKLGIQVVPGCKDPHTEPNSDEKNR